MPNVKQIDIEIAPGIAFRKEFRFRDKASGDYFVVTGAVAEIFDNYTDKNSLLKLTCDTTDGATGWLYVTATSAATGALTDAGGGANDRVVRRWGEWQMEVQATLGGVAYEFKFVGQVNQARDLNPSAPA